MKPFHTIAVPHDDILQGRLTLDVFAADLWQVYHQQGAQEYRDPLVFFQKTHLTAGLKNLIEVVQGRLQGRGGDAIIQMQTPFGGGKTHSLIALYHKAREWGIKSVVICGTPLSARKTLWGVMAEQLGGANAAFEDAVAPGRDAIQDLLGNHQPVLILMDEVLEYMVKAAAVKVGESTLAAQTLAFMQELTEAAATHEKVALIITLPSSTLEHYDEQATRLFEQLKRISGRVEKIYTPVQDEEIGAIIRQRLFSHVDEVAADKIINAYLEQAEREALLARGEESINYRNRFKKTYPFLPEVIDVLYHRWGSFPSFQRTRGTLRLLALVVHALKDSPRSYISLADFDLKVDEIRRELLNHTGTTYDSVIAADILSAEAGAHKVNREIGKTFQGLGLGERIATTIFMYSFLGGGGERGATLNEIKRQNLMPNEPASIVSEVLGKLNSRFLFYLHEKNGRYFFSTNANLNHALMNSMENISSEDLRTAEREILEKRVSSKKMKTYLWPESPADIPDDGEPKLLILPEADVSKMQSFVNEKGQTPRVHRNTLFFLTPSANERLQFESRLRRYLATQDLLTSRAITLTAEQQQELRAQENQLARDLQEHIVNLYRLLYMPAQTEMTPLDLGIATFGESTTLDQRVYDRLKTESRLVERLAPLFIQNRYLTNRDYVKTQQLVESGSRTPGEMLAVDREVWKNSIGEGVRQGLFGLGVLDEQEQPRCLYFKEEVTPSFVEQEVLIRHTLCEEQKAHQAVPGGFAGAETGQNQVKENLEGVLGTTDLNPADRPPAERGTGEFSTNHERLRIRLNLPIGKTSNLLGLINLLHARFKNLTITIQASQGSMTESEIEDKVRETFRQMGANDVEIDSE